MEVSSSSCSSALSLHRLDSRPPLFTRPVSHFSSKPSTRFTPSSTCTTSFASSSYFRVSISQKPSKSKNNYTLLRRKRGSFYIAARVFERFTEKAIKAVMFSQRKAKALGKDMVFTQHLLLGLITEDCAPAGFLESGIITDVAREDMKEKAFKTGFYPC